MTIQREQLIDGQKGIADVMNGGKPLFTANYDISIVEHLTEARSFTSTAVLRGKPRVNAKLAVIGEEVDPLLYIGSNDLTVRLGEGIWRKLILDYRTSTAQFWDVTLGEEVKHHRQEGE